MKMIFLRDRAEAPGAGRRDMNEIRITNRSYGKTAELIKVVEAGRDRVKATLASYAAVLADLKGTNGTRLPTKETTVGKLAEAVAGVVAEAAFTVAPPEVRVRIKAPEPVWDGKAPIKHVMVIERAIRDASFFLFGRQTGPGYTLALKAPRLTEDGQWIETKVRVVPFAHEPQGRISKKLQLACDRARKALLASGTKCDFTMATEAPKA